MSPDIASIFFSVLPHLCDLFRRCLSCRRRVCGRCFGFGSEKSFSHLTKPGVYRLCSFINSGCPPKVTKRTIYTVEKSIFSPLTLTAPQ